MASKPRLNILSKTHIAGTGWNTVHVDADDRTKVRTGDLFRFVCTHEQGLVFRGDKKQWWLDKLRLREIATARRLEKERTKRASIYARRAAGIA